MQAADSERRRSADFLSCYVILSLARKGTIRDLVGDKASFTLDPSVSWSVSSRSIASAWGISKTAPKLLCLNPAALTLCACFHPPNRHTLSAVGLRPDFYPRSDEGLDE
jgi:hypothetical protein